MSPTPGSARLTSTTDRPAEKGANADRPDAALVRRAVDALVEAAAASGRPMRRSQARAAVIAHAKRQSGSLDGWSHWLRNEWGIHDPTGESAVRNVGGGRDV